MTERPHFDPAYVAARKVLLDALITLDAHSDAVVLAGAQAVYLRTGDGGMALAPYTVDGDIALNPRVLSESPRLAEAMEAAGFTLIVRQGSADPGAWGFDVQIDGRAVTVPVDLIVPEANASPVGSRGARLGGHGNLAARKVAGLEAALLDNDAMTIGALDPDDGRSVDVRVAGVAALLIAKAHKLGDRLELERPDRLSDKDAVDVVRMMGTSRADRVALTLEAVRSDDLAGSSVRLGLERLFSLFGAPTAPGVRMAIRGVEAVIPAERVSAVCVAYCAELRRRLAPSDGPESE